MNLLVVIYLLIPLALCQDELDNLAYKKLTWQTSQIYSSEKAVDGLYTERSPAGNQCAISKPSPTNVTWLVDLGGVRSISEVRIYYRLNVDSSNQTLFESRFRNFSLYLSNTTIREDGFMCFHENGEVNGSNLTLTVRCEGTGQFVIFYNSRESKSPGDGFSEEAYIELCEVQVIGCPLGFWGHGCSKQCPKNCLEHCRYSTGECIGICSQGFTGKSCENYERVNMALHRPTFQLNTVSERHPSSRLVDGKQSELHINNNQCSSTCNYQCYAMWRVDLQNTRRIERIVVYSRRDNVEWVIYYLNIGDIYQESSTMVIVNGSIHTNDVTFVGENNEFARKLLGFSIIVSNTTDLRDGVVCYDNTDYNISTTPSVVDIFCSVVGRYVIYYNERLPGVTYPELYSQYAFADLCEVEVYGCPVPGYGHEDSACTIPCSQMCKNYLENLSYMKQTWLSSPFDGSSDKAVDGRFTSRSISDQQCTLSQPNATITWWVNLGKIYMIDHIVMYFRTENLEWGINNGYTAAFLGFSLYISNTTDKEDGILCHHDTTYTRETIPDHVSIDCPYHGQYVIFYNERLPGVTYPSGYSSKAYGDLCEVEVYGCPSPVADNSQCSNPCPENCEECFPGTGYCIRCKRGFEGIACEMVCQAMIKKYSIEGHSNYTGLLEDLHTSKGVTFFCDYRVSIDMFLTEESKNVASISFTVHKTSDVMVTTVEGRDFRGLAFNRVTKEKEHWDMTVPTSIFSTAYLVSIGPLARPSFTLSNLRLPLRKCYKNTR